MIKLYIKNEFKKRNADALSRIKINTHDTDSVINNPGVLSRTSFEYSKSFATNPDNLDKQKLPLLNINKRNQLLPTNENSFENIPFYLT